MKVSFIGAEFGYEETNEGYHAVCQPDFEHRSILITIIERVSEKSI